MPEKYLHMLPMVGMWAKEVKSAVVDKEMVRGLLIAFVAGGIVLYGTVQTLGTRLDNVEASSARYELQVSSLVTSQAVSQVRTAQFEKEMKQIKSKVDAIHQLLMTRDK